MRDNFAYMEQPMGDAADDNDEELDLDVEKKGKSKVKLLIVALIVAVSLILGSTIAAVVVLLSDDEVVEETEGAEGQEAAGDENLAEDGDADKAVQSEDAQAEKAEEAKEEAEPAAAATAAKGKAVFYSIKPHFVVNFQGAGRVRFLQIQVDVVARSDAAINAVEENLPFIKNDLIALFSSKTSEELSTYDGREALRQEATKSIQNILERETGSPSIESVQFTSFVMQ